MTAPTTPTTELWVIGNATKQPWLLNLRGPYPNRAHAQRAINWQHTYLDYTPDYWKIVTTDELRQLLPTMNRAPYTQEAWERFKETINA
jgi:hypothetical protein